MRSLTNGASGSRSRGYEATERRALDLRRRGCASSSRSYLSTDVRSITHGTRRPHAAGSRAKTGVSAEVTDEGKISRHCYCNNRVPVCRKRVKLDFRSAMCTATQDGFPTPHLLVGPTCRCRSDAASVSPSKIPAPSDRTSSSSAAAAVSPPGGFGLLFRREPDEILRVDRLDGGARARMIDSGVLRCPPSLDIGGSQRS